MIARVSRIYHIAHLVIDLIEAQHAASDVERLRQSLLFEQFLGDVD